MLALWLQTPAAWLPLIAQAPLQRPRAAAACLSASVAGRTRHTRTITVVLPSEDPSEDIITNAVPLTGRVHRTAALTAVELIDGDALVESVADDGLSLAQPERVSLLTREQEVSLAREVQVLTMWRRVRKELAAGGPPPSDDAWAAAVGCTTDGLQAQLRRSYACQCHSNVVHGPSCWWHSSLAWPPGGRGPTLLATLTTRGAVPRRPAPHGRPRKART